MVINNLPKGYKQSKVGVIPEDWDVVSIQHLATSKGIVRGPFGGALKKNIFTSQGYKVYQQKNAIYKSIELGEYYIDEKKYQELNRFSIQTNDFIISCSGTIGRIYKIPNGFKKGIINQALLKITLNTNDISLDYFYYQFINEKFQSKIIDDTQGGAIKNLVGISDFKKSLLPVAPLPEQEKIAKILTTWDNAIEQQQALIAKKQQLKKGLMQQLLTGKTRFPAFTYDWQVVKLGDICNITTGTSKSQYIGDGENYIIDMGSISKDGKLIATKKTNYSNDFLACGDLVMPKDDIGGGQIIGKVAFINSNHKYILGDHVFRLTVKNDDSLFLSFLINNFSFNKEIKRKVTGSAQLGLSKKSVESEKLKLPHLKEQQKIAEVLSNADKEIELLNKELNEIKQQKKSLMQKLLTGKVRVKL